jgi:hypothetical protein
MDTELLKKNYPDSEKATLSSESYSKLFYECNSNKNPLHIALYAELMCRMTMLQLSVEESFRDKEMKEIMRLGLPSNIKDGITTLQSSHKYYYLYPHFWQIFIYVFGGFILEEKKENEYKMLSELTGIPLDEIPNALMAFDVLFPKEGSWLFKTNSNITILYFMPLQLSGVGANFRRIIYRSDDEHVSYEDLGKQFASKYTLSDLIKYNNLLIEYLFLDPKIRNLN